MSRCDQGKSQGNDLGTFLGYPQIAPVVRIKYNFVFLFTGIYKSQEFMPDQRRVMYSSKSSLLREGHLLHINDYSRSSVLNMNFDY